VPIAPAATLIPSATFEEIVCAAVRRTAWSSLLKLVFQWVLSAIRALSESTSVTRLCKGVSPLIVPSLPRRDPRHRQPWRRQRPRGALDREGGRAGGVGDPELDELARVDPEELLDLPIAVARARPRDRLGRDHVGVVPQELEPQDLVVQLRRERDRAGDPV